MQNFNKNQQINYTNSNLSIALSKTKLTTSTLKVTGCKTRNQLLFLE